MKRLIFNSVFKLFLNSFRYLKFQIKVGKIMQKYNMKLENERR